MTGTRTSAVGAAELLVALDRTAPNPLHRQVEAAIREAIRTGRLRAGSPVPSTRTLAADLELSRGVVVEAYQQLVAEGYLTSTPGGATTVAATTAPVGATGVPAQPARLRYDLLYGRPDVSQFPRAAWLRSTRRALAEAPADRLIYLDGRGAIELRTALADYLNRVRGTWATPDRVAVCSGFAQGFALTCQVLLAAGARRLAVEDPSFDDVRAVAAATGLQIVAVPVTADGLDVDALESADADAVLVTPAHQLTGAVLAPARRAALLRWAERGAKLIIEDDYDAEYRYDQAPVGALQGLAPDRVLYTGSASKTLAPGLRLGWLVAPAGLIDRIAAAKVDADRGSPVLDQLAFADFLTRGEFDRHLRRMRPVYRRRRDALLRALADRLPMLRPAGVSAGLHVMVTLPAEFDESAVVRAAAAAGVGVNGLAQHRISPSPQGALIFGFAKLNERALTDAVGVLAGVIDGFTGATRKAGDGKSVSGRR